MCDDSSMLMECWTEEFPITFDGLVVEAFSRGGDRWHVAQLVEMRLEDGRKGVKVLRIMAGSYGGVLGGVVPERNWPLFAAMVAEVNRVRHERYGLASVG